MWCIGPLSQPVSALSQTNFRPSAESSSFPLYTADASAGRHEILWEAAVLLEDHNPPVKDLTALVVWDDGDDDAFGSVVCLSSWTPLAAIGTSAHFQSLYTISKPDDREALLRLARSEKMERFYNAERDRGIALDAAGKAMRELKRAAPHLPLLDGEIIDIEATVCLAVTDGGWWERLERATVLSGSSSDSPVALAKRVAQVTTWIHEHPVWS